MPFWKNNTAATFGGIIEAKTKEPFILIQSD